MEIKQFSPNVSILNVAAETSWIPRWALNRVHTPHLPKRCVDVYFKMRNRWVLIRNQVSCDCHVTYFHSVGDEHNQLNVLSIVLQKAADSSWKSQGHPLPPAS